MGRRRLVGDMGVGQHLGGWLHGWLDEWQAGVFGTAKWTTHVSKDSLLLYPQKYTIQDGDETIVMAAESCTILV